MKRWNRSMVAFGAAVLMASTCLGVVGAGVAGAADKSPILVGYIGDLTGPAASTFADGAAAAQARIDLQNAQGGIDGHPIQMVTEDTESSPTTAATDAEELVSKKVVGIIENSALFFGGAPYLLKEGIPVTGTGIDGPEWNTDTNLFDAFGPPTAGEVDGHYWTTTGDAAIYKLLGVTKIAGVANQTESAVQSVNSAFYALEKAGLKKCYENTSLPLGSVNITTLVLAIQSSGCNGLFTSYVDATDIALAQGIKNAGLKMPGQLYAEGYDNNVLDSPSARAALQGDYFATGIDFSSPNTATKNMLAALKKYDPAFHGGIPDLGIYGSWQSADLMVDGLQAAASHLTSSAIITDLHKVSSFNAGGILASSFGFNHFGTPQMYPKQACEWVVELKGANFVTINGGKPICGTYEPVLGSS